MAEHSGKCSRELECLRDFQIRDFIDYKRRGVATRGGEKHQKSERERERERERESIRERVTEEEACCLRVCVVNRDCFIAILKSVVCSSMNIAKEVTVGLCEHPGTLSSLSPRATALL